MKIEESDQKVYCSIDGDMDTAFTKLYSSFCSNPNHDFDYLTEKYLPEFFETMFAFFYKHESDSAKQDLLFNNLRFIWKLYYDEGRFEDAWVFWRVVIRKTSEWESNSGLKIHKGAAYFYWAHTLIRLGRIDEGFILINCALEEYNRINGEELSSTPAFKFLTLDYKFEDTYFKFIIAPLEEFLNKFIEEYRGDKNRYNSRKLTVITIDIFRNKFLKKSPSVFALTSFTYTIAKLWKFNLYSRHMTHNKFAGQYELRMLFDLIMVIDETIKFKYADEKKSFIPFKDLAEYLAKKSDLKISIDDLLNVNNSSKLCFENTLIDLIEGRSLFGYEKQFSKIENDLLITYCIRNYAAHNLTTNKVIWLKFEHILQSVFNILFLCVDVLYDVPCKG